MPCHGAIFHLRLPCPQLLALTAATTTAAFAASSLSTSVQLFHYHSSYPPKRLLSDIPLPLTTYIGLNLTAKT
jgi:hypothetical protein